MVESIIQSSACFLFNNFKRKFFKNKTCCLSSIDNTRFIKPVYPGDQMIIKVYFKKKIFNFYFFCGLILVKDVMVCQSSISLSYF